MDKQETIILNALQNLVTYSRFMAYKKENFETIAELLDQADHLFNLLSESSIDYIRIENILRSILIEHPYLSTEAFNVSLHK